MIWGWVVLVEELRWEARLGEGKEEEDDEKVTVNNFPKNAIITPKTIYKTNWKYGFIFKGYSIGILKDVCTPKNLLPTKSAPILATKAQINNFPLKYLCISSIFHCL